MKNIRRDPPIEKEMDDRIVKATNALEHRIDDKLNDLKNQIQRQSDSTVRLQGTLEKGFHDLERSIGRLEGKCETCMEVRK